MFPRRRPDGLTPPLWFSVQFGVLLLMGPVPATLVAGVGSVTRRSVKERKFNPDLIPTATLMVATLASGLFFNWLVKMPGQLEWVWQTVLVGATVVAYCAVKGGLTFVSRS